MDFIKDLGWGILEFIIGIILLFSFLLLNGGKEEASQKHGWDLGTLKHGQTSTFISVIIGVLITYIMSLFVFSNTTLLILTQSFVTIIAFLIINKTGVQ